VLTLVAHSVVLTLVALRNRCGVTQSLCLYRLKTWNRAIKRNRMFAWDNPI